MRAALVVLAACSSAPQQRAIDHRAAPTTPPPTVARGGTYGLTALRMPAVSRDGARVVAAFRESDGDRGLPNLTIVIKDRADAEVARHVVLSIAEADGMLETPDAPNPQLTARIERANVWLAEHAPLLPMTPLEPERTDHPADRRKAIGGPLVVTWAPHRLTIVDGPTTLVDRETPKSWVPDDVTVGTNACLSSPYLGAAAIDRERRVAVVTISSVTDSDFCLPATDQHHVIVW